MKNVFNWNETLVGNVTAEAHQKLALRETYKKEKRLYVTEQQLDMKYDKMRMRLNKYVSHLSFITLNQF